MKTLISTIFILTVFQSNSQTNLLWSRDFTAMLTYYFVEAPEVEFRHDTIVVFGRKNTQNGQRLGLVRYDLNGDTISLQELGNDSVSNNVLVDFKFDSKDNVYLLQKEKVGSYKSKLVLQKYSSSGTLDWIKQISSLADTSYSPHSIGFSSDSIIYITYYKDYDYQSLPANLTCQLARFDQDGNQIWNRSFDPTSEIDWFLNQLFILENKAYLFSFISSNIDLLKIDKENSKSVHSTSLQNGVGKIIHTPDNNLIITSGGWYKVSKVSLNGITIWTKSIATNLPSNVAGDEIKSAFQDSSGNIYVTGRHYGDNYGTQNYTNADILTIKFSASGIILWQNRYEHNVDNADIGNFVTEKNGNVYVGGQSQRLGKGTDYDYLALKINSISGVTAGEYRFNGINSGDDACHSLDILDNGKVAITGLSLFNTGYDWTTQLLTDLYLSIPLKYSSSDISIYPNPSRIGQNIMINGPISSEFKIHSINGYLVKYGILENYISTIDLNGLNQGVYIVSILAGKTQITKKLIIN